MIGALRTRAGAIKRRLLRRPPATPSEVAAEFWNAQAVTGQPIYWAELPQVRAYVNECVTTAPWVWPLSALKIGWAYTALPRGLSIGCGTGELERAAFHLHICERMDAWDISPQSIRTAKAAAAKEHVRGVHYAVRDCDRLTLPREKYDIVFFHGSLHHISDPDRLLAEVEKSLRPHGVVYVDEYIGPSRDEWSDEHLRHAREEFEKIPDHLKLWPVNPPLDYRDPSEMIRSSRIRGALTERFEVVHDRPYWGNLLFPLFCALDGTALMLPEYGELVSGLVEREKELVREGAFPNPLYSVFLVRKAGGR